MLCALSKLLHMQLRDKDDPRDSAQRRRRSSRSSSGCMSTWRTASYCRRPPSEKVGCGRPADSPACVCARDSTLVHVHCMQQWAGLRNHTASTQKISRPHSDGGAAQRHSVAAAQGRQEQQQAAAPRRAEAQSTGELHAAHSNRRHRAHTAPTAASTDAARYHIASSLPIGDSRDTSHLYSCQ